MIEGSEEEEREEEVGEMVWLGGRERRVVEKW